MKLAHALAWVVARAAYPGILVASLLGADALLARGLPAVAATTAVFVATLATTLLLERAYPHAPQWRVACAEAKLDLPYLGLAAVLQPAGKVIGLAFASALSLALVAALGPHDPGGVPMAARALVALALADLGKYTLHRLAHEHAALWRFHAEHHAPARMNALNATRLHPVNLLWNLGLDAAAPALLGLDLRATTLLAALRGSVAVLQHANVRLALGPLSRVFSTPELHQWHHSVALDEANANYGSTLIVWDTLFGTRLLPGARRAPDALGLADGAPHPRALLRQLIRPFCAWWGRCEERRLGA